MPLITGLEIDNFRCFEKLRVGGLTRVNLFVGKNNSGKTALLEAVEAVASVDSPIPLYRASIDRGESRMVRDARGDDTVQLDVRRWFYGHRLDEGVSFSVRATGVHERSVTVRENVECIGRLPSLGVYEHSITRTIERTPPEVFPGPFWLNLDRPGARSLLPRPVPRTRGDEPLTRDAAALTASCSPHARG